MPIVGVSLRTIEANHSGNTNRDVKINNKANVTDIKEMDLPGLGQKGLSVEFSFSTNYSVEDKTAAEIKMTGELLYYGTDCKDILKQWKKSQTIPDEIHVSIINTIFRRCVTRAISLSEDIQLPPPIGLPFAQLENKKE